MSDSVFTYLGSLDIAYSNHEHPAVYTVAEANKHREGIEGMHCKNLFLEDSKRGNFYLLTTPAKKEFKINDVRKMVKAKKLSFASPEIMEEIIGLEPGAASPFGLINDTEGITTFLVDREVWDAERVTFHPNTNTMTLELRGQDFRKFVQSLDNKHEVIDIR